MVIDLSKKIKDLAEKKKLSVNKLSAMSGMSQPTLQAIIDRNDAKLSQIIEISKALNVDVKEFLFEGSGAAGSQSLGRTEPSKENSLEADSLRSQLSLMQQLLDSKDEQIQMLKQELARVKAELTTQDRGRDARKTG